MLDLSFVRDNLPRVEEMLRQRGADPAVVLKDFREVDTQRRQAITEAETMKAHRNKASEDISKLKKSGQDATAAIAETKDLREQIQVREKAADDLDARLRDILAGIPNMPNAGVPVGHSAEENVEVRRWGAPPSSTSLPSPTGRLANNSACLIWNVRSSSRVLALRFTGIWARNSSGRWPISCSICTRASMDIPRFCRLTWLILSQCMALDSCPSLPLILFGYLTVRGISG